MASTDENPTCSTSGYRGSRSAVTRASALIVETDHYRLRASRGSTISNGIPSSPQKKVTERYWREGQELRFTVTVEDLMFLGKPASLHVAISRLGRRAMQAREIRLRPRGFKSDGEVPAGEHAYRDGAWELRI